MITGKKCCGTDMGTSHGSYEHGTCTVTENQRDPKRSRIVVDLADYNNLKKDLSGNKKTHKFLRASGKI